MYWKTAAIVIAFGSSVLASRAGAAEGTYYCWGIDKARGEVWLTDAFTREMAPGEDMASLSRSEGREHASFLEAKGVKPSPSYCQAGGFAEYVKLLRGGFTQGRIVRSTWRPKLTVRTTNLIDHPELHARYEKLAPNAPPPVQGPASSSGRGSLVVEAKAKAKPKSAPAPATAKSVPRSLPAPRSVDRGSAKSKCKVVGKRFVCPTSAQ